MLKTAKYFLYSLVVLLPYLGTQYFISPYTDAKSFYIRFAAFIVVALATVILVFGKSEKEKLFQKISVMVHDTTFRAVTAAMIVLIFSTAFAYNKTVAFFGEPQRAEGFLTLFAVYALFVGFRLLFEKKDWVNFFLLSSISIIPIFIIQLVFVLEGVVRPDVLTGNSTFLAGYYIFTAFSGLVVAREGIEKHIGYLKTIGVIAAASSLIGIFFCGTRGGIIGMYIAVIISAICLIIYGVVAEGKKQIKNSKLRKIGVWILSIAIICGALFGVSRGLSVWNNVPGLGRVSAISSSDDTTQSRLVFWKTSVSGLVHDGNIKNLALGWGPDNFLYFWGFHNNPTSFYYDNSVPDRSHNKLVDVLVMTGIVGFAAYVALWFLFIKKILALLRKNVLRGSIFVFFAVTYAVFLMFAFDTVPMLIGFYSIVAFAQIYE